MSIQPSNFVNDSYERINFEDMQERAMNLSLPGRHQKAKILFGSD